MKDINFVKLYRGDFMEILPQGVGTPGVSLTSARLLLAFQKGPSIDFSGDALFMLYRDPDGGAVCCRMNFGKDGPCLPRDRRQYGVMEELQSFRLIGVSTFQSAMTTEREELAIADWPVAMLFEHLSLLVTFRRRFCKKRGCVSSVNEFVGVSATRVWTDWIDWHCFHLAENILQRLQRLSGFEPSIPFGEMIPAENGEIRIRGKAVAFAKRPGVRWCFGEDLTVIGHLDASGTLDYGYRLESDCGFMCKESGGEIADDKDRRVLAVALGDDMAGCYGLTPKSMYFVIREERLGQDRYFLVQNDRGEEICVSDRRVAETLFA